MVTKTVALPAGAFFHARPCGKIAGLVKGYDCSLFLFVGSHMADGANPISLMQLGHPTEQTVQLMADGPEAEQAIEALAEKLTELFH